MAGHIEQANDFLSRIPIELRCMIKEFIPVSDLRTHVCFYKSYKNIAALYDDDDKHELFWKRACWFAGLGLVREEDPQHVSWKGIAFECIERCGFCKHPHCGGVLLERNAAMMADVEDSLAHAEQDEIRLLVECPVPVDLYPGWLDMKTNPVLGNLAFDNHGVPIHVPNHSDLVTSLQPDGVPHDYDRRLRLHPITLRSFATFPPVDDICLLSLYDIDFPDICRTSGVTVFDLQLALYAQLYEPLYVHNVIQFLDWHEGQLPEWPDLQKALDKLDTLYHLFSFVRWDGLGIWSRGDDGIFLTLEVSAR
ncbi:hypothetical protein B0H21DRAFT_446866 [Amylocystis lapponica]|nr:hypothetical protein B0H21DRAFT_446866 [Amylocystis lapponica]